MLDFSEALGVVSLRSSFSSRFFSAEIIRLEVIVRKLRYQLLEIPRSSTGTTGVIKVNKPPGFTRAGFNTKKSLLSFLFYSL